MGLDVEVKAGGVGRGRAVRVDAGGWRTAGDEAAAAFSGLALIGEEGVANPNFSGAGGERLIGESERGPSDGRDLSGEDALGALTACTGDSEPIAGAGRTKGPEGVGGVTRTSTVRGGE